MKKQLLNEQEIRKFMKFANIGALTENFIDKIEEDGTTEPELEEALTPPVTEEEDMDVTDPDMGMDLAADVEGEPTEAEPMGVEIDQAQAEEILTTVVDSLSSVLGIDAEVESSPEVDDAPVDDAPVDDVALDAEEDMAPAPPEEEGSEIVGEKLVQEVVKRVAARLLKKSKK